MLTVSARLTRGAFTLDAAFGAEADGVVALFGASGAGKTTLADAIAGLVRPEAGRIALEDRVALRFGGRNRPEARAPQDRLCVQDGRLFPHLSVRRNLLYGHRFAPREGRYATLERIVTLLGLEALLHRRPGTLSGGERQRVALGRALMAQPELLLMDEPLAALDVPRKAQVIDYIERLRDEIGVPIVFVSHAVDEVARLAGTIVVMAGGRVAAAGPAAEVMARLDLDPLAGIEAAGAVLDATVQRHDTAYGLSELTVPGGILRVPRLRLAPGRQLRVRVRARDRVSRDGGAAGDERPQRLSRPGRRDRPAPRRLGRRCGRHRRPAYGTDHGTLRRCPRPRTRQGGLRAHQERRGRSRLPGAGGTGRDMTRRWAAAPNCQAPSSPAAGSRTWRRGDPPSPTTCGTAIVSLSGSGVFPVAFAC